MASSSSTINSLGKSSSLCSGPAPQPLFPRRGNRGLAPPRCISRRLLHGEVDGERAPLPQLALHGDATPVGLHDVVDDGQSETASLHVVHQPGADSLESSEDSLLLL